MKLIRLTPENLLSDVGESLKVIDWLAPGQSYSLRIERRDLPD
jgi:hypothetical protein